MRAASVIPPLAGGRACTSERARAVGAGRGKSLDELVRDLLEAETGIHDGAARACVLDELWATSTGHSGGVRFRREDGYEDRLKGAPSFWDALVIRAAEHAGYDTLFSETSRRAGASGPCASSIRLCEGPAKDAPLPRPLARPVDRRGV
jgi:hypothetical protein